MAPYARQRSSRRKTALLSRALAALLAVGTLLSAAPSQAQDQPPTGRFVFVTGGRENLCADAEFTGWDRDGGYGGATVARADLKRDGVSLLTER